MKSICSSLLALVLASLVVPLATGQPVKTEHVTTELVSEWEGLVPGQTNTVAVRLEMDDHWHTYWANPGETGLPTEIQWTLPDGIAAGPIQWPAPQWINYFDMVSYAYEEEVLLLVDLTISENFQSAGPVELVAKVDFLVCQEACIPGSADLTLSLPVMNEPTIGSWKPQIEAARKSVPRAIPEWEMKVVDNGESFAFTVLAPEGETFDSRSVTYFSLDGWVAPSKPRTSLAEGRVLTLLMPKAEYEPEEGRDRFQGVLVSDSYWEAQGEFNALEVNLTFSENNELTSWLGSLAGLTGGTESGADPIFGQETATGFGTAILFALFGGILLNLMPCVFPVLSIKILGFVQQAGDDKSKIKLHGIVFTLGVLVSFWILAGLFLGLRAAGQEIGWGFQLQTPGFVAVLASVLFLFGLNLSGVFEIGETLTGAGSGLQAKSGLTGSFFSGVLATVVATPCTAPFMGSALGIIITLSALESMTIFTALALGVALPYLVLSFFPGFLKWLPRPGAWMESFKNALAFLLYATVVWLAWVFGNQVGVNGMAGLLLGLVFMGVAAWVWGSWGTLAKKKSVRRVALLVALPILLFGGFIQFKASGFEAPAEVTNSDGSGGIGWASYSPESVNALVAEGKTVYVDFTAKWCLTCQVNKKVAFDNDEVIQYFESNNIVALIGDWTRRDPVITRELQKFGRSGVPTNIIYRPDGSSKLLPEILTPGIVLGALSGGTER
jgi:thiol:disulfide interchange protein/DsbC/DsbD-like thiol-disulfide interchange protein